MSSVRLPRPRDVAYEEIKRRIILNELKPEETLTELGLARELGCSQGTIREALLRLQEDGLVHRAGHRGTSVTGLDPEEAEEILAVRRRIETRGALRAASHVTADALSQLDVLQEAMEDAARSGDEYRLLQLDTEFHLAIFRLSGLQALEQILIRCTLHSHRSKLWAPGHRRPLLATALRHRVITEKLAAGNGPALAAAVGEHIDTIVQLPRNPPKWKPVGRRIARPINKLADAS
jgi:GntR family transcriptional regulator, rspAB operon transcriptional repressor